MSSLFAIQSQIKRNLQFQPIWESKGLTLIILDYLVSPNVLLLIKFLLSEGGIF